MRRNEMRSAEDDASDLLGLSEFCDGLFTSLGRSDQRRWAEIYVKGLLVVPGRKSIRRISEVVAGRDVDQSLQQFVNQSPWAWEPVRRRLAEQVTRAVRPRAWVVREVAFPKNGGSSVGVARQYAATAGRMLNCQRAVGVFAAGDEGAGAVNWRLLIPKSWDDDADRRAKTKVPEDEHSKPTWQYLLDAFGEMTGNWGLPAAPVVVDLGGDPGVLPLLGGLEERGMRYLAQVSTTMPVMSVNLVGAQNQPRTVVRPRAVWMTNLGATGIREIVRLLHAQEQVEVEVGRLTEEFGLRHFEGRSFQGWHHHVTLASAAHGYRLLRDIERDGLAEVRLRPYA